MRWLDSITDLTDMKLSKFGEIVEDRSLECCSPWGRRGRHDLVTEQHQLHLYFLFWQEQKGEASTLESTTNSIYC